MEMNLDRREFHIRNTLASFALVGENMFSLNNWSEEDFEKELNIIINEKGKKDCDLDYLLNQATLFYLNCPEHMKDKFLWLINDIERRMHYLFFK